MTEVKKSIIEQPPIKPVVKETEFEQLPSLPEINLISSEEPTAVVTPNKQGPKIETSLKDELAVEPDTGSLEVSQ